MGLSVCWEYSRKSCSTLREKERKKEQPNRKGYLKILSTKQVMTGGESKAEHSRGYLGSEKPGVFLIQGNRTLQILLSAFIRKPHGGKVADRDPRGGQQ